jgi:hypothetical protein
MIRPSDMVMLESALRNHWDVPTQVLRDQLAAVQALFDDPGSSDRSRLRARRIMELSHARAKGNQLGLLVEPHLDGPAD